MYTMHVSLVRPHRTTEYAHMSTSRMCMYVHTHIYMYVYIPCMLVYIHVYMRMSIHANTPTVSHSCMHTCIYLHTCMNTYMHTYTYCRAASSDMLTYIRFPQRHSACVLHTYMRIRTFIRIHTYTYRRAASSDVEPARRHAPNGTRMYVCMYVCV